MKHGCCSKRLWRGSRGRQGAAGSRARGTGGLQHLEEGFFLGGDGSVDDFPLNWRARTSASSARGYQGVPVATGPRLQHEWKELPLAVLVEPSPVSRSHSRAMPTLTPLPQHSERHPGDTQMAPGGPTRVMGRCEAARLHFPITPLAGTHRIYMFRGS